MVKYLKDFTCMISLADDVAVIFDEIIDIPKSEVISSSNGTNHRVIFVLLLAIACLLLLFAIILKYYIKRRFHAFYFNSVMIENLVRQWFFQGDNKNCFTSSNQMAHYAMRLFQI